MRRAILIAGAAAAALALGGCQTFSLKEYAEAANDLDEGCGKLVDITVTPMMAGFWVIPVVSGRYVKACEPAQINEVLGRAPASPPGAPAQ